MTTVWHGDITPRRPRTPLDLRVGGGVQSDLFARQGDEMGRFNMGSTVVLVLPPATTSWLPECKSLVPIRNGAAAGEDFAAGMSAGRRSAMSANDTSWRPTATRAVLERRAQALACRCASSLRRARCSKSTRP